MVLYLVFTCFIKVNVGNVIQMFKFDVKFYVLFADWHEQSLWKIIMISD